MSTIEENVGLRPFNTFGINVLARYFASFATVDELGELLAWAGDRKPGQPGERGGRRQLVVLGGGSNVLFTKDVEGVVLRNAIRGIELIDEDQDYVYVRAGAGEVWQQFVDYCIGRNWAGVENLSLIPGSVGAAPMQNIGAYGVELREVFYELEAWHIAERKIYTFTLNDCEFGYRDSVFKRQYRGQFVILNVTFRLAKRPVFHTGYGAIKDELERMGVRELSIRAVSAAVTAIRRSKLPDPAVIGNAGSFFKNPTIPDEQFDVLQAEYMDIVGYHNTGTDTTKLAAGWLIEQCGWKGFRRGDAGVHARQALVLVNYGGATGQEIYDLSQEVLDSVYEKFGVELEREVNMI
ncbi:MAG TPA: UDP-N-acetylmuramate dehydrogenase [Puia sp.]|nr:UDP-N-acetylmuramate dehydrogenase [Puia sp.]